MAAIPGALGYVAYNTDVRRCHWYKEFSEGANWSGQISPPRQEEGEFHCGVLSDISVVPECVMGFIFRPDSGRVFIRNILHFFLFQHAIVLTITSFLIGRCQSISIVGIAVIKSFK